MKRKGEAAEIPQRIPSHCVSGHRADRYKPGCPCVPVSTAGAIVGVRDGFHRFPDRVYPDQLVAQILGAATYPDQVTAADDFVNSSGLKDNALVQAVDKQPWDPSVKALCVFPMVLDQTAKNLARTSPGRRFL